MRPASLVAVLLGLTASAAAAGARAQVLQVGDGGTVTVLAGPAVTTREGVTSLRPSAPPPASDAVSREIASAAARHGLDARLVRAVAVQESGLRQAARSPKGAVGVMQLMPATARALGVDAGELAGNVEGGTAYLQQMLHRFGGDVRLALAAYNAGPGAVERHGGPPPFAETQAYVRGVLARWAALPVEAAQLPVALAASATVPPLAEFKVAP